VRSIVVGLDTDGGPRHVLDAAIAQAVNRGLPLHLAYGTTVAAYGHRPPTVGALDAALERAAQSGLTARLILPETDAVTALVEAAELSALLVVGVRPHSARTQSLLGSVSVCCLQRTRCPVMVVPYQDGPTSPLQRVVVGVDGGAASLAALAWATAQSREWRVPLEVVGVAVPGCPADLAHNLRLLLRKAGAERLATCVHVRSGVPSEELLRGLLPSDLLVVGSRGHGAVLDLLLGSTSTTVLEGALCPTVVVQAGQARRELHQRQINRAMEQDLRPARQGPSPLAAGVHC
jgi:nucleotide-binding universal stress UspA family protein